MGPSRFSLQGLAGFFYEVAIVVNVLCVSPRSIYKSLQGVECWDYRRNAWSFLGNGKPIVAHPPCRSWSKWFKHQAKPEQTERSLAIWIIGQLQRYGGVLEHPAQSELFEYAGLPKPGDAFDSMETIAVDQCWWGHKYRKRTWLCYFNIQAPQVDLVLTQPQKWRDGPEPNPTRRSATPVAFAKFL